MDKAWHELTAMELGAGIAAGAIDPADLAEYFLERIAAEDPEHLVFIRMATDRTRAEAQAARQRQKDGLRRGPWMVYRFPGRTWSMLPAWKPPWQRQP